MKLTRQKLLSDLGIEESLWNRKLIQGFSGGQRQRIMLARALITDPKLLFADEPTSMQDVSTRWDLVNQLKNYHQRGMSLVFVTHDLLLAKTITQRGIVLYRGQCAKKDPPHYCSQIPYIHIQRRFQPPCQGSAGRSKSRPKETASIKLGRLFISACAPMFSTTVAPTSFKGGEGLQKSGLLLH